MAFFTKDKVGKTVFLLPTESHTRINTGNSSPLDLVEEATINDIKRVKITITRNNGFRIEHFEFRETNPPKINNIRAESYAVFESKEQIKQYLASKEIRKRLRNELARPTDDGISTEQLLQIAQLLEWNDLLDSAK